MIAQLWLGWSVAFMGCGRPATAPHADPSPAVDSGPVDGDLLVVALPFDPGNVNPLVLPYSVSFEITDLVTPGLVRRRPSGMGLTFEPALAESFSWSADGSSLTYGLRAGLSWEDGTPLTSADVAFTQALIADPVVASNWHGDARFVSAIETPDPRTITFRFDQPRNPQILQSRTVRGVLPQHALADVDRATLRGHASARAPLASGPWKLTTWEVDDRLVLEPNLAAPPEWQPHLERIVLRVLPEYSTRLLELERGSVDLVSGVEIGDLARLSAIDRLHIDRIEAEAMQYVGYNLRRAPFDERELRTALTAATDRLGLIDDLLTAGGVAYGQPCVGTVSPRNGGWVPADLQPIPFDTAAAIASLQSMGWVDGDGDGVRARGPQQLSFPIMVQTGSAELKSIAVRLQSQWKAVGVDLQIEMVEPTRFSQRAREGDFDAILWSFGGSPVVDPSIQWRSDGQYNWMGLSDPEIDQLIDEGLAATDLATAKARFQEVQRRVHAEQPATFLFWRDGIVARDGRFRDVDLDSYSSLRHAERWWVPKAEQKY